MAGFQQSGHDALDGDLSVQDAAAILEIAVSAAFAQAVIGVNDAAGNQLVVTNLANVDADHDRPAQTDPTLFLFSDTSPDADNTQWGSLAFIAATDTLDIASGSGVTQILGGNAARFRFVGSTSSRPQMFWFGGNAETLTIGSQSVHEQNTIATWDLGGNQIVLCNSGSVSEDAGHVPQTNPTLYIHSDLATSAAGAAQWGSFAHDQSDFVLTTGVGDINPQPASGFVRGMRRVIATTVNFNSASPLVLATVQDGDIVTGIWAEVTAIWNGNGTVDIGDGTDPDGYLTNTTLDLGVLGYKGAAHNTRGALLWDPGALELHDIDRIYAAGDTVDATVVTGTSTLGSMVVYVELARLKA